MCGMSAVFNKFRGCSNLLCHSSGILSLDVIDSSTLPLWASVVMSVCVCVCVCAESLQPCSFVTPVDCSPPGCSVCGILQAKTLEWVAMPSSRGSSRPRDGTRVSHVSCIGRRVLITSTTLEVRTMMDSLSSLSQAHPMGEFSPLGTRQPFCT